MSLPGWTDPNTAHLSELEKRCASLFLRITGDSVEGPPVGLLVGEMPGAKTSAKLPLFPHPRGSTGGRLMAFSGQPPGQYLGKLARVNLMHTYSESWGGQEAYNRAKVIVDAAAYPRVVLLGKRVSKAFGLTEFLDKQEGNGCWYTSIPHPSGLNRFYNDPLWIKAAHAALCWAMDVMP